MTYRSDILSLQTPPVGRTDIVVDLRTDWGGVCLTVTIPLVLALLRLLCARRDPRPRKPRSRRARTR